MDNISKKLEEILSGVDMKKLEKGRENITSALNSQEGRNFARRISSIDKDKLFDAFSRMDANEIKRKIASADMSKLSSLKADEVINKLNNL